MDKNKEQLTFEEWIDNISDYLYEKNTGLEIDENNGGWDFLYENGATCIQALKTMIENL